MTALETPTEATRPAAVVAPSAPKRAVDRRLALRRVMTISLLALCAIGGAYAVFRIFESPVANAWYSTRQHQLASQIGKSQIHSGRGNAIAVMQIPRLGTNLVVAEGDSPQQLRSGPGHRIGTPLPGAVGNSVIVGHNRGWGGPFNELKSLKKGDLVVVAVPGASAPNGVFKVDSTRQVDGDDTSPFANSTDRRVTFIAGAGGSSDHRLVVTAVSGPVGKLSAPGAGLRASTSAGSLWWNANALLAAVALLVGGALAFLLRRRLKLSTLVMILAPMAVLALLCVLLNIDAALPPLR